MNLSKFRYAFLADGWEDYQYWLETDQKILKKINALLKDCQRSPFEGIGKPEPLQKQISVRLIFKYL